MELVNNSWGSACFIWSKGNFMNAKVIKIGVVTIPIVNTIKIVKPLFLLKLL